MDSIKIAVRYAVLTFVFAAGAFSIAGLNPAAKAGAESIAKRKPSVEKTYISSKKESTLTKEVMTTELGNTG